MTENAYRGYHGECAVNPFVGKEALELKRNGNGRKIVVCGAGAAGLTAAYILALRGFSVTVLEESDTIGGQLKLASAPPKKGKIAWLIEDLEALCKENGVEILTSTPATPEKVAELKPCNVICAMGSKPVKPYFDGEYSYDELVTFEDVLNGSRVIENKKVAVIGSGMTGLETAEFLNEHGCKTVIIEMADEVAPGTWMQHLDDALPKLKAAGTVIKTGEKLVGIYKDRIITQSTKADEKTVYQVDEVVLALGSKSNAQLADGIKKLGIKTFVIGDNAKVGRIANATRTAYEAAVAVN